MIYFDYAAATPVSEEVFAAMTPYFTDKFYNPSALYLAAKGVSDDINNARGRVAKVLGVRPSEIIFTAGGTEANNLAINGIMQSFGECEVLVSAIEHDSVMQPAMQYPHKVIAVDHRGLVDVADLASKINDKTVLVSVMYVNNEIGTLQPIKEISSVIKKVRKDRQASGVETPLYLHCDAAQAGNCLPLLVDALGVDLLTVNGGKIYGPKQSGVLYVRSGTTLRTQIQGGGQEFGKRSGTENAAFVVGFAQALQTAQSTRKTEYNRLAALRAQFIKQLSNIKGVEITQTHKHIVPSNVHFRVNGQDNERLMMALDEKGIMCAVGSACSASSDEPSHVLKAIGLSDQQARSSLRFTMGRHTTSQQITQAIQAINEIVKQKA